MFIIFDNIEALWFYHMSLIWSCYWYHLLYTRLSCLFYLIAQSYGLKKKKNLFIFLILLGNIPRSLCCAIHIIFSIVICKTNKKTTVSYFIATIKNSRISANTADLHCEATAFGLCYSSQVIVQKPNKDKHPPLEPCPEQHACWEVEAMLKEGRTVELLHSSNFCIFSNWRLKFMLDIVKFISLVSFFNRIDFPQLLLVFKSQCFSYPSFNVSLLWIIFYLTALYFTSLNCQLFSIL